MNITADQFFIDYHEKVFTGKITLQEALALLRDAYRQYPDRQARITAMAQVVKTAINKAPKQSALKENVVSALL